MAEKASDATNPTFESLIPKERERLHSERKALVADLETIQKKISAIDLELKAIEAYEQAKAGVPRRAGRARKGSKRTEILGLISKSAEGLSRGELIDRIGVKGNKPGEQSISNALSALKRAGSIDSLESGKYLAKGAL